ncbi:MAG: nucleotide exchange factor GrpE [Flavobacteriales bacterium]|nr:nucleotide exchange factor GrpE [Flavobacteriales bacterium]MBQ21284.1 nucleotide exchange factor GrpE [Flavobacteriales bacterium]|tara:strand:- start:72872 stop:73441 length:570 start_codon:yes stop_codon:yes gene_type:complete
MANTEEEKNVNQEENAQTENEKITDEQAPEINNDSTEELTKEEQLEIEVKEAKDKYLRLYSDFENFRKRTQKEKLDLYKTAGEEVITALLPVIDDFERASKAMQDAKNIDSVKDGMKLIHEKMLSILKQKGLEPAKSQIGEPFNVEFHEAITQIPAPSKKEVGKVIDEVEKGYSLNGKVIRYTKVVVGQ